MSEQKSLSVSQAIKEIYAMSQPTVPDPVQPGWVASVRWIAAALSAGAGAEAIAFPQYAIWLGIGSVVLGALAAKGYLNNRQAS